MPKFGPIEREPWRPRPPYDQPITEAERHERMVRIRAGHGNDERLAALLEPLDGMEVAPYEHRILAWLAGWEDSTVAVVAALRHRARAADPLPVGRGHTPADED